jgi:hypothetical protein
VGKISEHHFPEPGDYQTFVDLGPDQEPEDAFTGAPPTYIALVAEACSLALFLAMVAVWSIIGDRGFPEVMQ